VIAPPDPPLADPVNKDIDPELPELAVPDFIDTDPDTPAVPAFTVFNNISPLDVVVP
jgi:hypothetical protein